MHTNDNTVCSLRLTNSFVSLFTIRIQKQITKYNLIQIVKLTTRLRI